MARTTSIRFDDNCLRSSAFSLLLFHVGHIAILRLFAKPLKLLRHNLLPRMSYHQMSLKFGCLDLSATYVLHLGAVFSLSDPYWGGLWLPCVQFRLFLHNAVRPDLDADNSIIAKRAALRTGALVD